MEPSAIGPTSPTVAIFGYRRVDPWVFPLVACFLLAALLGTRVLYDPDLGYHLKGGQWIVQNHLVPVKDTFTYTASGHDYLDIHWFYQVLLYVVYRVGGYSLISLANGGFVLILLFLTWKRFRLTNAPGWMCVPLLAMVLLGIEIRFYARPETISCILMSLTLWILESRLRGAKDRLVLLPILFIVWANIEGLFAVGWVIVGIYCIATLVQPGKADRKLLLYSALTIPACLINPYLYRGLIFPFTLLHTMSSSVFKNGIQEFQSPWALGGSFFAIPPSAHFLLIYKIFTLFFLLLMLATFRKRKIHEILLAVVFFGLSAMALRNDQLFMLSCGPILAACWKEVNWDGLRKFQDRILGRPFSAWLFTFILLGLCLRVANGAYFASDRRLERFGLGLRKDCIQAVEFLNRNHLDGKIINHLNAGGWLDWQGSQKTFIDGRLEVMGEGLFRELMESSSSTGLLKPLLNKYQPDILFFSPLDGGIHWIQDLRGMTDWRPVYLDGNNVIYLHKGYANQITNLDYDKLLMDWGISKDILSQATSILGTPIHSTGYDFLQDFITPPVYPRWLLSMGIFSTFTNHFDVAEAFELEGVRQSQGRYPEFYINLRNLFAATNQYVAQFKCEERIQEIHSVNGFIQASGSVTR